MISASCLISSQQLQDNFGILFVFCDLKLWIQPFLLKFTEMMVFTNWFVSVDDYLLESLPTWAHSQAFLISFIGLSDIA